MYRYLSDKTADYTATVLSIPSTTILPQTIMKNQVVHKLDNGGVAIVGISDDVYFDAELQWSYITTPNHAILLDFWHNETKGAGIRRTFYWAHPIDNHIYTIKFKGAITSQYDVSGYLSVNTVPIRVLGNQP